MKTFESIQAPNKMWVCTSLENGHKPLYLTISNSAGAAYTNLNPKAVFRLTNGEIMKLFGGLDDTVTRTMLMGQIVSWLLMYQSSMAIAYQGN